MPHPDGAALRDMSEVGGTSGGRTCGAEFDHDGDGDAVIAHYAASLEADGWRILGPGPPADLAAIREELWFDLVVYPEGGYGMRVEQR